MKVVIVGAGIAGLSTYLSLRKRLAEVPNLEIKIYEGYDISRYIDSTCSTQSTEHITAPEQTKAEIAARSELTEEGFNVEAIGSAIGIAKNGLDVLSRLFELSVHQDDEDEMESVLDDVAHQGHPISRWEISCARGWMLADVDVVPKSQREKQRPAMGRLAEALPASDDSRSGSGAEAGKNVSRQTPPVKGMVMIGRQAFWSILLTHVIKLGEREIVQHKRISSMLIPEAEGSLPHVEFANGSKEEADLIIGADGLRSIVRKRMYAPYQNHKTLSTEDTSSNRSWLHSCLSSISNLLRSSPQPRKDYVTPHYEGLVGVGGFVPSHILEKSGHKPGTMSIVFGPNGFFGHGFITSTGSSNHSSTPDGSPTTTSSPGRIAVYWSTFASPDTYPYALPPSASAKSRPYEFDRAKARSAMLSRHKHWKNPTIQAILKHIDENPDTQPEGFYPTWTTPELSSWSSSSGRVVLVGDAAHALQASSGQGATQALEDAEALALVLKHHLLNTDTGTIGTGREGEGRALKLAMRDYEAVRRPRVHAIYERSQKMSGMKADMGFVMEMMMCGIIKIMTLFHDEYNEKLINYDLPRDVEEIIRCHS